MMKFQETIHLPEFLDMVLIYGECQKNASLTACVYSQRFPERRAPTDTICKRLEGFLGENWPSTKKPGRRLATGVENEVAVLEMINENPHCSNCWR